MINKYMTQHPHRQTQVQPQKRPLQPCMISNNYRYVTMSYMSMCTRTLPQHHPWLPSCSYHALFSSSSYSYMLRHIYTRDHINRPLTHIMHIANTYCTYKLIHIYYTHSDSHRYNAHTHVLTHMYHYTTAAPLYPP